MREGRGFWAWACCALLVALALSHNFAQRSIFEMLFPPDSVAQLEGLAHPAADAKAKAVLSSKAVGGAPEEGPPSSCADQSQHCASWAQQGECDKNAAYMLLSCARSCKACAPGGSARESGRAADAAAGAGAGGREAERSVAEAAAAAAAAATSASSAAAAAAAAAAASSAAAFVCSDEDESCALWAAGGECEQNPMYMRASCPLSCGTCEEARTACDRVGEPGIAEEPRGLDALFERILSDPEFAQYKPTVLSRSPWVVTLEGFLRPSEGDAFVSTCNSSFARSLAGDQLSPVRTSFQCWCSHDACIRHPEVQALTARVAELTRIPEGHAEYAQVIRYEPGQFYRAHHDQNSAPWTPHGVRLLTLFMYINDVAEGGGTRFTDLGITVQPRRGRAVLWPSVLGADLARPEPKTHHEALPPVSGVKYGVNLWLHQYDFKTPSRRGCKLTTRNTV